MTADWDGFQAELVLCFLRGFVLFLLGALMDVPGSSSVLLVMRMVGQHSTLLAWLLPVSRASCMCSLVSSIIGFWFGDFRSKDVLRDHRAQALLFGFILFLFLIFTGLLSQYH